MWFYIKIKNYLIIFIIFFASSHTAFSSYSMIIDQAAREVGLILNQVKIVEENIQRSLNNKENIVARNQYLYIYGYKKVAYISIDANAKIRLVFISSLLSKLYRYIDFIPYVLIKNNHIQPYSKKIINKQFKFSNWKCNVYVYKNPNTSITGSKKPNKVINKYASLNILAQNHLQECTLLDK